MFDHYKFAVSAAIAKSFAVGAVIILVADGDYFAGFGGEYRGADWRAKIQTIVISFAFFFGKPLFFFFT